MEKTLYVLFAFTISFVLGIFVIPRIIIISKKKHLFDILNDRKVHTNKISRLGGVSFFPCAMFAFSLMLGLRYYNGLGVPIPMEGALLLEFLLISSAMFAIYFIGLADDLVGVGYKIKFVVQIFAAIMIILAGLGITNLEGFLFIYQLPLVLSILLTIGAIVLTINAFNLIDGIDGLCSGSSALILTLLGSWYLYMELYVYASLAFSFSGIVLIFFVYNTMVRRLKIFMGDTGSLTLGLMIVFLGLKFIHTDTESYPYTQEIESPLAIFVSLIFVPVFDATRVFFNRIIKGLSPFHPDKTHVHHKLLQMNYSHLQSTAILILAQLFFVIFTIILSEVLHLNINIVIFADITLAILVNMMINRRIAYLSQNRRKSNK